MTRGEELLFSITVCLKGAVVRELEYVSRVLYRIRVWKVVMGVVVIVQWLVFGFVVFWG
jgi:hypothetical protein